MAPPNPSFFTALHNYYKLLRLYLHDHPDYEELRSAAAAIDPHSDTALADLRVLRNRSVITRNKLWLKELRRQVSSGRKPNAAEKAFFAKLDSTDPNQSDFVWVIDSLKNEWSNIQYGAGLETNPLLLKVQNLAGRAMPKKRAG